ncbi:MAG: 50S ribosomal protein L11 [Candidatus Nanohaloarchaeota archaeon QJJ-9]|nr:50S ribosomal protein L11 [Candidatus Nanohaloarchaeota archaeon QJJ-9]
MAKKTISALIEGGSASAGPPLGPQLGPTPVNVGQVVNEINEKTKEFNGMEVPVDVIIDDETGEFEIEVGTPPTAELVKEKAGIESGSGEPDKEKVADLKIDQVKSIADMKDNDLVAMDLRGAVKEVIGTCQSMGVKIDGKDAQEVQNRIDKGKYNDELGE